MWLPKSRLVCLLLQAFVLLVQFLGFFKNNLCRHNFIRLSLILRDGSGLKCAQNILCLNLGTCCVICILNVPKFGHLCQFWSKIWQSLIKVWRMCCLHFGSERNIYKILLDFLYLAEDFVQTWYSEKNGMVQKIMFLIQLSLRGNMQCQTTSDERIDPP